MRLPISILFFRLAIFAMAACWGVAGPGCAPRARPAAATPAPTGPKVVGEVAVVDEEKKFVLIDLDFNLYVPSPGTALRTTNAAGETAHLQASPEQKRPFVAADIVDGDPAVGDQVVR
jgi:hypothetical protein